jgi:hypothetical protein
VRIARDSCRVLQNVGHDYRRHGRRSCRSGLACVTSGKGSSLAKASTGSGTVAAGRREEIKPASPAPQCPIHPNRKSIVRWQKISTVWRQPPPTQKLKSVFRRWHGACASLKYRRPYQRGPNWPLGFRSLRPHIQRSSGPWASVTESW